MASDGLFPRRWVRRAANVFLAVTLLALLVPGVVNASPAGDVQDAKARLAQIQRQLDAQNAELAAIQQRLNAAATRLEAAEAELQETNSKIALTREAIAAARERMDSLVGHLQQRARNAYINGPGSTLALLLSSDSLADLSDRLEFLNAVQQNDTDLATDVANEEATLDIQLNNLADLKDKQAAQAERRRQERDAIAQDFAAANAVQDRLASLRAEAEDILAKQQKALEEWQNQNPPGGGGGGVVSGGPGPFYACPVPGGGISDSFGAPRTGHLHAGNDIFQSTGAPIQAPFNGTVSTSSSSLGGLGSYVHGSEGYVYNAHLSSFAITSGSVSAGQVIGYVGSSGNASGTSPHDHFEWHPNVIPSDVQTSPYGYSVIGSAVNPHQYLLEVC